MKEQLWALWWADICETHGVRGWDFELANDSCCCRAALCLVTSSSVASSMEISAVNSDSDLISVVVHHRDGDSD